MAILELIKTYPQDSVVILIILIALVILVVTSKRSQIKAAALYLVSVAEEEWGSKTGQLKFDQVYATLKSELPIVTLFLTDKVMKDIIEKALIRMKSMLAAKEELESKQ